MLLPNFTSTFQLNCTFSGLTNTEPFNFDDYEQWSRADLQRSLMNAVRSIADGQPLSSGMILDI